MWGRELRAGLVFVLASVTLGGTFRAWERAHHERLDEIVTALSEGEAALAKASTRANPAGGATDTTQTGSQKDGVPGRDERASRVRPPDAAPPRPASIDPDRATLAEWLRLPGIGPTLAARILADRAAHGSFGGPGGLLRVPGIGPKTLAKIQVYLTPLAGPAPDDSTVRDRAK